MNQENTVAPFAFPVQFGWLLANGKGKDPPSHALP